METFLIGVAVLIAGYFVYGKYISRFFGADESRVTPAIRLRNDIDYMPLPVWKIFLIQFLNIAGLGPIFGAILGAAYGPIAFLWITLGCIFAGGVHDYFSGMMSIRHDGLSITEIVGIYMGKNIKAILIIITMVLLIMVGAVFVTGPAKLLENLTSGYISIEWWIAIIFIYYFIATLLPIDQLIGKIYPIFGVALLFMAFSIGIMMVVKGMEIPNITLANFHNFHDHPDKFPLFPMMFITIACGAISGFHGTQSPMMARCMKNEKMGQRVFYGAMITEGIVTMIWAAAAMGFYHGVDNLNFELAKNGSNAAVIVQDISVSLLGKYGGLLAIIGVIVAPISTGDTALRSARLITSDFFHFKQKNIFQRIKISTPIFLITFLLTQIKFDIIWRYLSWTNQILAMIILWTTALYLKKENKSVWIAVIPAIFMSITTSTYFFVAPEGIKLPYTLSLILGAVFAIILTIIFFLKTGHKQKHL